MNFIEFYEFWDFERSGFQTLELSLSIWVSIFEDRLNLFRSPKIEFQVPEELKKRSPHRPKLVDWHNKLFMNWKVQTTDWVYTTDEGKGEF